VANLCHYVAARGKETAFQCDYIKGGKKTSMAGAIKGLKSGGFAGLGKGFRLADQAQVYVGLLWSQGGSIIGCPGDEKREMGSPCQRGRSR